MVYKRTILKKILAHGGLAEFTLVKDQNEYQGALYVNGIHIPGPPLPRPLHQPKGEITHWMGNKPSVGLTAKEAAQIIEEIEVENQSLHYRAHLGGK